MRRTFAAVAMAAVLLPAFVMGNVFPAGATAAAADAGAGAPADGRARRAELLLQIAALTDRLEDTQADVVAAQFQQARLSEQVARVRARVRARAVQAYIHGIGLGAAEPAELAAPAAYLEVAARKDRERLAQLRTATTEMAQRQDLAEAQRAQLRGVATELDQARNELDRLVAADDARRLAEQAARQAAADQAAAQRAGAEARSRALAAARAAGADALGRARVDGHAGAGGGDLAGLLPRHLEATRRQAELMGRYPFGVLAPGPLPASLMATGESSTGLASWYGGQFNGRPTASGAIYDELSWTAASRTLPLGTLVVVSHEGVRVLLVVNDRGPYVDGRILDLSAAAAQALGVGVSEVQIDVVVAPSGRR
jgi:3D (Asp-Asp-Asp) domain-containing protein